MFKRTLLVAAIAATPVMSQAQTMEQMQQQLDILAQEIEGLKAQKSSGSALDKLHIGGYGEHHFNHYNKDPEGGGKQQKDQVDAHRFVLFVGYDFSEKVRFFSELEVEHGLVADNNECSVTVPAGGGTVTCTGDEAPGEVELEQAYIEIDTSENTKVKVGQFLVPVGLINETHEPDTFYGVERNTLEKEIIPATWWETGAMFSQDVGAGVSYDIAGHSGLNLGGGSSIRSGRQKSAKADANKGAVTARVTYNGIAGLHVASTVQYQQDVNQDNPDLADTSARLVEAHVKYTVAGVTLTAQKARWDLDDKGLADARRQEGELYEISYKLTDKFGVFGRHENIDTTANSTTDAYKLINTYGVNYWVVPQVALKADIQNVNNVGSNADDNLKDSVNIGLGWSF